ncbi:MAG: AAA family ATPase [Thermomicrobiales bacterium]
MRTSADSLGSEVQPHTVHPDLMPADISGTNVLMESPDGERRFAFQQGPIFSNLVLADEINRATPKTQAALLSMQDRTCTVAG